jgi:hypothetical protein
LISDTSINDGSRARMIHWYHCIFSPFCWFSYVLPQLHLMSGARSLASEITFLVEKLTLIKRQIGTIERTLVKLVDETEEGKYLLSITGINYIAAAGLLAELGCFRSYRTAKQMIKMAGSNPTERESAGKRGAHTPMSKQGRPVLRYCSWTSVIPMLRFNADFRDWVKKRRERPAYANPLGGQGDAAVHFGDSLEPTRVHNMVPLPSWPNPNEV